MVCRAICLVMTWLAANSFLLRSGRVTLLSGIWRASEKKPLSSSRPGRYLSKGTNLSARWTAEQTVVLHDTQEAQAELGQPQCSWMSCWAMCKAALYIKALMPSSRCMAWQGPSQGLLQPSVRLTG